jgi:ElaB/YqjD/DUF883 family membrane-anchored ribosome-binding protein
MAIKVPILSEWNPKGLDKAKADFQKLEKTSEKVGFAMKKAFLPATAALGALTAAAGASLKAAVEDAAQQEELARQIQAVTGATDEAVAANEEFIAQMELAVAVSDAQLRPALGNLVRATGDVTEAQDLLGIALDISAATGKDLNTVSEALSKAYQGETSSLKRLDPSLTAVIKSGADFNEIGEKLAETFGGAAADAADTAEGRFKRMQIQIDNAQESIGYALLPILEKLIPILEDVATFVGDNTELIIGLGVAVGTVAGIIVAYNVAMKLYAVATGIASAATAVFNAILAANPVVLIALAIAGLIVTLIALEKKFGVVTKIIEAVKIAFDKVSDAVAWLAGKFVDFINTLIDVANKIPFVNIEKLNNVFEEQAVIIEDEVVPAIEGYGEAELELAEMIAEAAYQQQLANIDYSEAEKLMSELHPTIEDIESAIAEANKDMEEHHKVQQFISDMNRDLIDEFDLLFRTFDNEQAVNDFTDALAEAAGITAEFGEDSREAAEANQQVYRELANVIEQLGNIPAVTQAQMLLDIERGELDRVMQDIAVFQHMADTAVTMLTSSEIAAAAGMVSGGNFTPAAAVPTPMSSTQIGGTRSGMKDGTVININGAIDPVSTAQQVRELLNRDAQRGGSISVL